MLSNLEMMQSFVLDDELRQDFDFVWHNFFKVIEQQVIRGKAHCFYYPPVGRSQHGLEHF